MNAQKREMILGSDNMLAVSKFSNSQQYLPAFYADSRQQYHQGI